MSLPGAWIDVEENSCLNTIIVVDQCRYLKKDDFMSLNANYQDVENYKDLYDKERHRRVVWETLVLYSIPVGLNVLTEKNIDEWWFRLSVLEILHGKPLRDGDGNKFGFGYSDVRRMLGLKTNATNLTRAGFLNNCKKVLERAGALQARLKKEAFERERILS